MGNNVARCNCNVFQGDGDSEMVIVPYLKQLPVAREHDPSQGGRDDWD